MKTEITRLYSSSLFPALQNLQSFETSDQGSLRGGFGEVSRLLSSNVAMSEPYIVKVLFDNGSSSATKGFETICELMRRSEEAELLELGQGKESIVVQHPLLIAMPRCAFEGVRGGERVLGYIALDLTVHGYDDFSHILDDDDKLAEFQSLSISHRLELVRQLVEGFNFLNATLRFIHADIKADAVFVNMTSGSCALIDFDSGALARDKNDKPTTFGTRQDWLAPEVMKQLDKRANSTGNVTVDLFSDIWSVNIAIHYLLFGCHPLFFLTEISERSLAAYATNHSWPEVADTFQFFRRECLPHHENYLRLVKSSLPTEVYERLRFTFSEGSLVPSKRSTYSQWQRTLERTNRISIERFEADQTFATSLDPVILRWKVLGARKLEIVGQGDVTHLVSVPVIVDADATYTLRAISWKREVIEHSVMVKVDKTAPRIDYFTADKNEIVDQTPLRLYWHAFGATVAKINGIDVTNMPCHEVHVRADTTFILETLSFCGISSSTSLTVVVSKQPPVISSFVADKMTVSGNDTLSLSWKVGGSGACVEIVGIGQVARTGTITLVPSRNITYTLRATSYFGVAIEKSLPIQVTRAPAVMRQFTVSSMFLLPPYRATLKWDVADAVEVWIAPILGKVKATGRARLTINKDTEIVLSAKSRFGEVVSRRLLVRRLSTSGVISVCDHSLLASVTQGAVRNKDILPLHKDRSSMINLS